MEKEPYRVEVLVSKCGQYTPWLKIPGVKLYPLTDDDGNHKKYKDYYEANRVGINSYITHLNHYHHKLTSQPIRTQTARERAEKLFKGHSK